MPATAADFFGTPNAGAIYGAMIVGTVPFTVIAIVALVALVLPLLTRMPSEPGAPEARNRVTAL